MFGLRFQMRSNDPDEPAFEVCFVGNGGGSASYPVAVVDCPEGGAPIGDPDPYAAGVKGDDRVHHTTSVL